MRTSLLVGFLVASCVVVRVGTAAASTVTFPDATVTQAIPLGSGAQGFVAIDNPGDGDIFIHPVNVFSDLIFVTLNNTSAFSGFAIWLDFEGFNQGFRQYGVYVCTGSSGSCGFGSRRGTFFL
jgi:hypothetical protein